MPHYSDSTEAKVGDLVKGLPYNHPFEIVGVVVGLTPDAESCNLRVAFLKPLEKDDYETRLLAFVDTHGQPPVLAVPAVDHGETKAFALLRRPERE